MPKVTPNGNSGIGPPGGAPKVGIVVATITFVPSGAQQWMCAAVVFDVKPLNDTLISIVFAVGSSTIVARPVPGELTGGTSFALERFPTKVIGSAWAAGVGSVRAAMMATAK